MNRNTNLCGWGLYLLDLHLKSLPQSPDEPLLPQLAQEINNTARMFNMHAAGCDQCRHSAPISYIHFGSHNDRNAGPERRLPGTRNQL